MAIITEVGTLTAAASTGTQTISLSSSIWGGETPKALVMWWSNYVGSGIAGGEWLGFGMAVSSSSRVAYQGASNNSATVSDVNRRTDTTKVMVLITSTGTVYEAADFDSFGAEEFVLDWTTARADSRKYNFMAIGGDSITNVALDQIVSPEEGETGTQNYTTIGFQPDAMIGMTAQSGAYTGTFTGGAVSIGVTDFDTGEYAVSIASNDAASNTDTRRSQVTDFLQTNTSSAAYSWGSVSQHASGYTIDWTSMQDDEIYMWNLCFKGGNFKTYNGSDRTSDGTESRTIGFAPSGALFLSAGLTTGSPGASSTDSRIGVGGWDSEDNMAFAGSLNEDNVGTTNTDRIHVTDSFMRHYDHTGDSGDPLLLGSATAAASGDNLVETWANTDGSTRDHVALVFGEPPAGAAGNPWYYYAQQGGI